MRAHLLPKRRKLKKGAEEVGQKEEARSTQMKDVEENWEAPNSLKIDGSVYSYFGYIVAPGSRSSQLSTWNNKQDGTNWINYRGKTSVTLRTTTTINVRNQRQLRTLQRQSVEKKKGKSKSPNVLCDFWTESIQVHPIRFGRCGLMASNLIFPSTSISPNGEKPSEGNKQDDIESVNLYYRLVYENWELGDITIPGM